MRALVTGSMGVLGRHFARLFKKADYEVHVCDIKAGTDCREVFRNNQIKYDVFVHCARPGDPVEQMAVNADLFSWVDRVGPDKVVYFSSTDVYSRDLQQEPNRITEDQAGLTGDGNALVALAAEKMALERGMFVFRPFEVYGESGNSVFQEVAHLVASREKVGLRRNLEIPGCGRVLDFIHVDDVVQAAMVAVDQDYRPGPVNLCTGEPTAVDELVERMLQRVEWTPDRLTCSVEDESFFLCGDPSLLSQVYTPAVSLDEGIKRHVR